MPRRLTLNAYVNGLNEQNRSVLGRAISLVESKRPADRVLAESLLTECMPRTGSAVRIGITGVPGVGKSTFIEALGLLLIENGLKIAVLAIDVQCCQRIFYAMCNCCSTCIFSIVLFYELQYVIILQFTNGALE